MTQRRIDWDHEESLGNWISDFDLYCEEPIIFAAFGTSLFIGYFASSLIFPRIVDKFGRSIVAKICIFTLILLTLLLMASPDPYLSIAISLIYGIFYGGRLFSMFPWL